MWPRSLVQQMLLPTTHLNDLVLDPFAGSGTTGQVAAELGRKAVLIEAAPACQEALNHRISRVQPKLPY